jgi:predicted nucleotidyltransferase
MGRVTNQEVIKELKRMKKELSKRYKIKKMLLFGSRARGDYKLTSDTDLIVISKDFEGHNFRDRPNDFLDAWILPVDFEVLCYTPEEFLRKKKEYGIVREAAKQGKKI